MMKKITLLATVLICICALYSCEREEIAKYQIFTINESEWVLSGMNISYKERYYSVSKTCTGITQDVIDNGFILVWLKKENYNDDSSYSKWIPVDATSKWGTMYYMWDSGFIATNNNIMFCNVIYDNKNITGQYVYKVVVISAKQMKIAKKNNLNFKDYSAVKAAFSLPD